MECPFKPEEFTLARRGALIAARDLGRPILVVESRNPLGAPHGLFLTEEKDLAGILERFPGYTGTVLETWNPPQWN